MGRRPRGGQSPPFCMTTQTTPLLLLAAGRSSRMYGRDKLIEDVRGQPLLRDRAQMALAAGFDVHVALPAPDHPRVAALDGLAVTALFLPAAAEGIGGTLRAAVAALPPCPRFMIMLADLPDLTADDLRSVLNAASSAPQALVWRGASGKVPGHPILCDAALRPRFAGLAGDDGGRTIMADVRDKTVLVPLPGDHATRDLDTQADWAVWRASPLP